MKSLPKSDPDYLPKRTELFKTLTLELLVNGVSVVHLSRQYELLIYLGQLLYVRERQALYNLMD